MKARDIMVSDVPVITTKATVAQAVQMLKDNYGDESFINAAPGLVVLSERGGLAGILTPLSVITALIGDMTGVTSAAKLDDSFFSERCDMIKGLPVSEIMERQAISVTEDAHVADIAELFVKHRFQRLPVVKGSRVVGIIYRSRLLFAMTEKMTT
ncbi:CBS domain pair-containing protein [Geotalea daltonii FRC-32]|uniref:CBS domain pair-containing protein n=2 Tax=Geotalea TaxID=2910589 RepID=B9M767_GEODF|nr:CBS domain-containing protein [Geotalea daltonii]ACM20155.1 CBS domain pair-containing protein [Geotalea daltonii FRC-32]